jgi:hypothetical protein
MTDQPIQVEESTEIKEATFLQKLGLSSFVLFLLVWVVGGIAALIMSIVCFGFSGSTTEKVVGLALAFFLGPLYFIFYAVNKDYCRSMNATVVSAVNRVIA